MSGQLDTYTAANAALDQFGNAIVQGANPAPRLTMDTIIALRSILNRHAVDNNGDCQYCRDTSEDPMPWPCPDAADVLKVLGLHDDDDERTEF